MTLSQLNSTPNYTQGIYQGKLSFNFFVLFITQLQKMFFNFTKAVFPQSQMLLILETLVYIKMCDLAPTDTVRRAKSELYNHGLPLVFASFINCVPNSQYIRFNSNITIEFSPTNNLWMSACDNYITTGRFRTALIDCHSYFETVKGKIHWIDKFEMPNTTHTFEMTNSFFSLPSNISNCTYSCNSKDFKCSYSNFFSILLCFQIVPTTNSSGQILDQTNWNTFNKSNFNYNNVTLPQINDTVIDLTVWYYRGNSEVKQKLTKQVNTQKQKGKPSEPKFLDNKPSPEIESIPIEEIEKLDSKNFSKLVKLIDKHSLLLSNIFEALVKSNIIIPKDGILSPA